MTRSRYLGDQETDRSYPSFHRKTILEEGGHAVGLYNYRIAAWGWSTETRTQAA